MEKRLSRFREISKASFDSKAANYDETWDGRFSVSMYDGVLAKAKMFSFETILDLGCGTGSMLAMMIKENKGIKAYGLDISENMLEKAAEMLGESAQLSAGDAENLPWQDNFFDLILCNSSFHHYPEPLKVLADMRRVLKPDGNVIIADPWWSSFKRFFINIFLKSPLNYMGDVRIYSEQEMYDLLTASGYMDIKWELEEKKYSICMASAGK